jgi:hypothetical protein
MLRNYIPLLFLLILVLLISEQVFAQPPAPALPGAPQQAPVDGGLTLLAAAGGAYAWRRLRRND